ncbi:MAG: hypothetical protein Q9199_001804 [Rusavskia elegans]
MPVQPPTPPSTAPTSPIHPAGHGYGDCVINVGIDPEKDGYNGDPSRSPTVADGGIASLMRTKLKVLLHRQDELAEMEKALIAMDDEDQELDQLSLESRRRDDQRPEEPSRKSLMTKIDGKLKDYDDLITRIRRNVAIPRPLDRDYSSLYKWIDDIKPLCRVESKFIKYQDDIIALAEKQEGGWFDGVLEDTLSIFPRPFTRASSSPSPATPVFLRAPPTNTLRPQLILSSSEERKKTDDEYVQLYSKYRVDVLARLILTVVAVVLLMVPTAVLFLVPEHGILKIMLIMIFTMLFSAALSVFTKAKRHEMFAATAAYCAVLVVFLGNLGPSPS